MSHNLRQNGRKVQTLSPFHNIKGGKMEHLDFCVASSMAGMAVSCSILFNKIHVFRKLWPPSPPPPFPLQIKGNWLVLVFVQLHLWFQWDGGLLFHFSRALVVRDNGKEMYKKVCCTCKVAFLLIRPIVVFHRSPALPSPLSITRFYILFEQTINIIESFAFSPGQIYILFSPRL